MTQQAVPDSAKKAVLVESSAVGDGVQVEGPNFESSPSLDSLLATYARIGFQASNFGAAVDVLNRMLAWRLSDEVPAADEDDEFLDPEVRASTRCHIWLAFTSNMMSSGLREIFVYLAKHKLVQCFVTTGGGIEEDFVKCFAPTYVGEFSADGALLRSKGWNRIGNLFVPNKNYCDFEDWVQPILDRMLEEQKSTGVVWTPSKMIRRLGEEINDECSLYYWCARNDIPVFCPGITDGALGDNIYFHSYRNPGLVLDVVGDIRAINDRAVKCRKSGMVVLGGGLPKHHVANANLMRNGADFAVYVSTATEYDGSDSGASPDEAVSWGKIRGDAKPVKVFGDATILFPLMVSQSFAQSHYKRTGE